MGQAPRLSVVVPLFNEASGLPTFATDLRRVLDALATPYEVVLVDDGSIDDTVSVARALQWPQARVATLARNVGHQAALDAGLSLARGEFIVTMDGDGQHPPELIPDMLHAAETGGVDVVYTVQRTRQADSWAKRSSALAYYRLIRWLTDVPVRDSQADFRLIRARVLDAVSTVPGDRVLRLLLPSVGFASTTIEYDVLPRISGEGRFGIRRQFRMASQSLLGYSSKPLRLVATLGLILSLLAIGWFAVVLVTYAMQRTIVGWTSVMAAVLLVGGLTLLSLSVVGSYIARIHDLLKAHPRYFIDHIHSSHES